MKKMFKIFFLLCLFITISGCKKNNDDYSLIEINIYELIDLFDSNEKLMFAVLNDDDKNSDKLLEEIEKYQKLTKNTVYYIDVTNVIGLELEYFNLLTSEDPQEPRIYILESGKITMDEDANITYQDLKSAVGDTKFKNVDLDEYYDKRDINYDKGVEKLENGLIGTSFYQLYLAKPKQEAKDLLEEENLYNLLGYWEYSKENGKNCEYMYLQFNAGEDSFYEKKYNGKCSSLDKEKLKGEKFSYIVKDDKILIEEDKKQVEKYVIEFLDKENLTLKEGNNTYNFKK